MTRTMAATTKATSCNKPAAETRWSQQQQYSRISSNCIVSRAVLTIGTVLTMIHGLANQSIQLNNYYSRANGMVPIHRSVIGTSYGRNYVPRQSPPEEHSLMSTMIDSNATNRKLHDSAVSIRKQKAMSDYIHGLLFEEVHGSEEAEADVNLIRRNDSASTKDNNTDLYVMHVIRGYWINSSSGSTSNNQPEIVTPVNDTRQHQRLGTITENQGHRIRHLGVEHDVSTEQSPAAQYGDAIRTPSIKEYASNISKYQQQPVQVASAMTQLKSSKKSNADKSLLDTTTASDKSEEDKDFKLDSNPDEASKQQQQDEQQLGFRIKKNVLLSQQHRRQQQDLVKRQAGKCYNQDMHAVASHC